MLTNILPMTKLVCLKMGKFANTTVNTTEYFNTKVLSLGNSIASNTIN